MAKDWQIIEDWYRRGIPQGTVIRAIQTVFERKKARGESRKVNSISYCKNEVEETWALEQRGLVGSRPRDEAPLELPRLDHRIEALVSRLESAKTSGQDAMPAAEFDSTVNSAIEKVRSIDPGAGFEAAEEALSGIERDLLKAVEKGSRDSFIAEIERQVETLMDGTDSLRSSAAKKLRKALTHKQLRLALGLPPLTLFDV